MAEARQAFSGPSRTPGRLDNFDTVAPPVRDYATGAAFYEVAEIHRMRGQFDEAETAYRQAGLHGRPPEPGLALLRLAQGNEKTAEAAIRRLFDEHQNRLARVNVLTAAVEIMVAVGDLAMARKAAAELSAMAAGLGAPFLRAVSAHALGTVLLAGNDPGVALASLTRAAS
jgi:hypothetical protein